MIFDLSVFSWRWSTVNKNWTLSKLRTIVHQRLLSRKQKDNVRNRENIFRLNIGLISRIYEEPLKLNDKTQSKKKWTKDLHDISYKSFFKDLVIYTWSQYVHMYVKKCPTSVVTGEMQIKATLGYHLTPN